MGWLLGVGLLLLDGPPHTREGVLESLELELPRSLEVQVGWFLLGVLAKMSPKKMMDYAVSAEISEHVGLFLLDSEGGPSATWRTRGKSPKWALNFFLGGGSLQSKCGQK